MASIAATRSSAKALSTVGMILGGLGIVGGLILVVLGVTEQCPAGDSFCSDYERSRNAPLAAAGVVAILFWLWLAILSAAISARMMLAADVADRS